MPRSKREYERRPNMLSICKFVLAAAAAGLAAPALAGSVFAATMLAIRSSDAAEPGKQFPLSSRRFRRSNKFNWR